MQILGLLNATPGDLEEQPPMPGQPWPRQK